jgi:hypothetical protein
MKIGDKVTFNFGKKKEKKEGVITKLFDKRVYLKVDFPKHKNKIIIKKMSDLK